MKPTKHNDTEFIGYDQFVTDSDWMIGIDPGHGGMVAGEYQTFPDKMYDHGNFIFHEGVFNRKIAAMLSDMFLKENLSHYLTTTSNYDAGLNIRTIRANNFIRIHPKKRHMYLSIHANAAPKGAESATGIEVFTSKGDTRADPMATVIYEELKKMDWKMRSDQLDGDADKEENFYVLYHTVPPAVLVELGFYTNKAEAELLLEEEIQKELTLHLYNAIIKITKHKRNVE